jgi:pimeloyl-ACP methyl ester carboxylesterase
LVSIPAGQSKLAGIVYGSGKTGIVFAHQSDGTACDWMPYAKTVVKKGFRALAFDFGGYGSSLLNRGDVVSDVVAAAAYLRATGVTRVILVGASMGGTAVLAAAGRISPQVAGVVSLSSPSTFGTTVHALDAIPRLTMPLLLICGKDDVRFVGDVQAQYKAATRSSHRELVLSESSVHGYRLVSSSAMADPKAVAALNAFLGKY